MKAEFIELDYYPDETDIKRGTNKLHVRVSAITACYEHGRHKCITFIGSRGCLVLDSESYEKAKTAIYSQ